MTDLRTATANAVAMQEDGHRPGGKFAELGLPLVAACNPRTGAFELFPTGGKGLYPHTGRFEAAGVLWYTLAFSNQVARLDPKTREVHEFDVPLVGPRRMRFSKDGRRWIPAFGDGTRIRLDPRTLEYTAFPVPKLSPEDVEMPCAVAVEPRTQDVWVTSNMSDRAFRFLAREQRFVVYPMPSRFTYTRDISFTKDGWACSVESNFPVNTTEHGDKRQCVDPGDAPKT